MMLGICHREGETRQTLSVMMVAFFALFSQIGAMILLISPEQIKRESCACAQNIAIEVWKRFCMEGSRRFYPLLPMEKHVNMLTSHKLKELGRWFWSRFKALDAQVIFL